MTAEREEHLIREAAFLTALDELIGCLDRSKAMQKVADVGHSVIGAKTCTVRLLENEGRELRQRLAMESSGKGLTLRGALLVTC